MLLILQLIELVSQCLDSCLLPLCFFLSSLSDLVLASALLLCSASLLCFSDLVLHTNSLLCFSDLVLHSGSPLFFFDLVLHSRILFARALNITRRACFHLIINVFQLTISL